MTLMKYIPDKNEPRKVLLQFLWKHFHTKCHSHVQHLNLAHRALDPRFKHPILCCFVSYLWLIINLRLSPKCNICTISTMRLRQCRKKLNFCVRDILRGPFTCTCLAVLWLGSRCLALLVEQHVRLICANVIFIDLLHFVVVKHPPSCPTQTCSGSASLTFQQ